MPAAFFFSGLLSLLLPVTWNADQGFTYTLQQSTDMVVWDPLPMVVSGSGNEEGVVVEIPGSRGFCRLRFSSDGDSNENGLPDAWEWSAFGYLDVDPFADPDLDGLSNNEEYLANSDPNDFYNGELPVLRITCGHEWLVAPGLVSVQAVSLYLEHASGNPWPDAPITLRLPNDSGGDLWRSQEDPSDTLIAWTDSLGRIHPSVDSIHYLAPDDGDHSDILEISAGSVEESLLIRTSASYHNGPPREFTQSILPNGSIRFDWSGDPSLADAFIIEEQTVEGEWVQLIRLSCSDLPSPDVASGQFTLVIDD